MIHRVKNSFHKDIIFFVCMLSWFLSLQPHGPGIARLLSIRFPRQDYCSKLPFSFSRESSWPGGRAHASYACCTGGLLEGYSYASCTWPGGRAHASYACCTGGRLFTTSATCCITSKYYTRGKRLYEIKKKKSRSLRLLWVLSNQVSRVKWTQLTLGQLRS